MHMKLNFCAHAGNLCWASMRFSPFLKNTHKREEKPTLQLTPQPCEFSKASKIIILEGKRSATVILQIWTNYYISREIKIVIQCAVESLTNFIVRGKLTLAFWKLSGKAYLNLQAVKNTIKFKRMLLSHKKEWNNTICSNMARPTDHTNWSKIKTNTT